MYYGPSETRRAVRGRLSGVDNNGKGEPSETRRALEAGRVKEVGRVDEVFDHRERIGVAGGPSFFFHKRSTEVKDGAC